MSAAHGELEGIVVQRLAALGFDDDGRTELQAGLEIRRDRVGLYDMHHVFYECPGL